VNAKHDRRPDFEVHIRRAAFHGRFENLVEQFHARRIADDRVTAKQEKPPTASSSADPANPGKCRRKKKRTSELVRRNLDFLHAATDSTQRRIRHHAQARFGLFGQPVKTIET
jgi:hypothetical protein